MKKKFVPLAMVGLLVFGCARPYRVADLGLNEVPSNEVVTTKIENGLSYSFSCSREEFVAWITGSSGYYQIMELNVDDREVIYREITKILKSSGYGMFLSGETVVRGAVVYVTVAAKDIGVGLVRVNINVAKK